MVHGRYKSLFFLYYFFCFMISLFFLYFSVSTTYMTTFFQCFIASIFPSLQFLLYLFFCFQSLCLLFYINFLFFQQVVALPKLRKMFFTPSKRLFSFSRHSNFCNFSSSFPHFIDSKGQMEVE